MSKFKVGDRVNWTRVRGEYDGSIIEAIGYSGVWPVTIRATNGNFTYVAFSELELAPRFAVGDKVRSKGAPEAGVAIVEHVKPEGGYRINFKDTWFGVCHGDDDDLTPTYTSCAAAEVDNLADEYGGGRKFKVGDRVNWTRVRGKFDGSTIDAIDSSGTWPVTIRATSGEHTYAALSELEHVAVAPATATLTIQAGRHYKTRDGRKVGPMTAECGGVFRADKDLWFFDNGRANGGHETSGDLIAEWPVDVPLRGVSPVVAPTTTAKPETTMADIVRRLEKLEDAGKVDPVRVGDYVILKVPARVTGIDKQNANIVTGGGGSFVLPASDLAVA